jgi:hypothetical protein
VKARAGLAMLAAERGEHHEARSQVIRCTEILMQGENWRGIEGSVILADAVTLAAKGDWQSGGAKFAYAVELARHYALPWDEAEAWHCWGRALRRFARSSLTVPDRCCTIHEHGDGRAHQRHETGLVQTTARNREEGVHPRRRLPLEAGGWEFQAESLLDRIGLQSGWTCLDSVAGRPACWFRSAVALGQGASSSAWTSTRATWQPPGHSFKTPG